MSYKVNNMINGVSMNFENQMYSKSPALDASVKFAGEEAKDRLYEPKHEKKLVRVLTVIAYVFFVSLAAIMLSLYYIFIWNDTEMRNGDELVRKNSNFNTKCDTELIIAELQRDIELVRQKQHELRELTTVNIIEENSTWFDEDVEDFNPLPLPDLQSARFDGVKSPFIKKLFYKNAHYYD